MIIFLHLLVFLYMPLISFSFVEEIRGVDLIFCAMCPLVERRIMERGRKDKREVTNEDTLVCCP